MNAEAAAQRGPLHNRDFGLLWASVILSLFSGYQYVQLYLESRDQAKSA